MKNYWLHALVGFAVGLICRMGMWIFGIETDMTIMAILVFAMLTIVWEMNQKNSHPISYNWLDGLVDLFAGNVAFWIPLLIANPIWKMT